MGVLRNEDGQRRPRVGDDEFDPELRGPGRTKFQGHLVHERAAFVALAKVGHVQVRRRHRPRAGDVMLKQREQFLAALWPIAPVRLPAVGEAQRVGQERHTGQLVEVRRLCAGLLQPFLPWLAFGERPEDLRQQFLLLLRRRRGRWRGGRVEGESNPCSNEAEARLHNPQVARQRIAGPRAASK